MSRRHLLLLDICFQLSLGTEGQNPVAFRVVHCVCGGPTFLCGLISQTIDTYPPVLAPIPREPAEQAFDMT
jgi:hypothetical protein